jgi:hypothetical protein
MRSVKDSGFRPAVVFLLPVLFTMAIALTQSAVDPPAAHAQDTGGTGATGGTGGTGGTSLSMADFEHEIRILEGDEFVPLRGAEIERYFSRARCECDAPVQFRIGVKVTSRDKVRSLTNATLELRVGDSSCYCSSPQACLEQNCKSLSNQVFKLSQLALNFVEFNTTTKQLFEAPGSGGGLGCRRPKGKQPVYLVAKIDTDAYSDLKDGTIEVQLDGEAPPQPSNIRIKGGNEALSVSWDSIELSAVDDMQGYVLFCSRDDKPVFVGENQEPAFNPPYETRQTLCGSGVTQTPLLAAAQTADGAATLGPDGTAVPAPLPFVERQKAFACTDLLTTQTSHRLFRLQNNITYLVGVASVDVRGNVSDIEQVIAQKPITTVDFYRDYRAEGGMAEGGFCAVAPRARTGGWLVVGLLAVGLALVARRRRGR